MNKQAIIEGLKEAGRVALISAIPVIIASLEQGETDWKVITIAIVVAVFKGLDKFLHKLESKGVAGGLTLF